MKINRLDIFVRAAHVMAYNISKLARENNYTNINILLTYEGIKDDRLIFTARGFEENKKDIESSLDFDKDFFLRNWKLCDMDFYLEVMQKGICSNINKAELGKNG